MLDSSEFVRFQHRLREAIDARQAVGTVLP